MRVPYFPTAYLMPPASRCTRAAISNRAAPEPSAMTAICRRHKGCDTAFSFRNSGPEDRWLTMTRCLRKMPSTRISIIFS